MARNGYSCRRRGVLCETEGTAQDSAVGFSDLALLKPTPTTRHCMKTSTEIKTISFFGLIHI